PSELYVNVLIPAVAVDQDHGWTSDYWTPANRNFIQDQRQEVIRFLVGLPARHPFRSRNEYDTARESLERTEHAIEMQRFILERLQKDERLSEEQEPHLLERKAQLSRELEANNEVIEVIRSTAAFFDREISALEAQRDQLVVRESRLARQKGQL